MFHVVILSLLGVFSFFFSFNSLRSTEDLFVSIENAFLSIPESVQNLESGSIFFSSFRLGSSKGFHLLKFVEICMFLFDSADYTFQFVTTFACLFPTAEKCYT